MKVLLVEDDASLRKSLVQILSLQGVTVIEAGSYIVAKDVILADFDGVVLSDIRMEGKDGFDVLEFCQKTDPDLPVIFMTGHAEVPLAVRALKAGAYDFLEKPCHPDVLLNAIRLASERRELTLKNRQLEARIQKSDPPARDFPGRSSSITQFRKDLRKLAALPVKIHIWGEDGAGKRRAAESITDLRSSQAHAKTVDLRHVSSSELVEMAQADKITHLTMQNVSDGSLEVQRDLLGLLDKHPNAEIITTARIPLADLSKKALPNGLYHRHSFAEISVPPLRHRPEDILEIFRALLQEQSTALNIAIPNLSDEILATTSASPWPGNISELRQWAQRVLLNLNPQDQPSINLNLSRRIEAFERSVLMDALVRHKGVTAKVADELGLPLKTLYDRLARHSLKSSAYRGS